MKRILTIIALFSIIVSISYANSEQLHNTTNVSQENFTEITSVPEPLRDNIYPCNAVLHYHDSNNNTDTIYSYKISNARTSDCKVNVNITFSQRLMNDFSCMSDTATLSMYYKSGQEEGLVWSNNCTKLYAYCHSYGLIYYTNGTQILKDSKEYQDILESSKICKRELNFVQTDLEKEFCPGGNVKYIEVFKKYRYSTFENYKFECMTWNERLNDRNFMGGFFMSIHNFVRNLFK